MDTQMWTVEGRLDPPALGRHTPWVPLTCFLVGRAQSPRGFATAAVRVFPTREGALVAAAQWAAEQGGPAETRLAGWRRDPATEPARTQDPGVVLSPGFRQKLGLLPIPQETLAERAARLEPPPPQPARQETPMASQLSVTSTLKVDTSNIAQAARIIARHLAAMAAELEAQAAAGGAEDGVEDSG